MTTALTHFPDRPWGVHVRGGHAAGKSHGESHRFSGTGISSPIREPVFKGEQVIQEIIQLAKENMRTILKTAYKAGMINNEELWLEESAPHPLQCSPRYAVGDMPVSF